MAGVDRPLERAAGTGQIVLLRQQIPQDDFGGWRVVGVAGVDGLLVCVTGTCQIADLA